MPTPKPALQELWSITAFDPSTTSTRDKNQHLLEWSAAAALWGGEWMSLLQYRSSTGYSFFWPSWYVEKRSSCLTLKVFPLVQHFSALLEDYSSAFNVATCYNKKIYTLTEKKLTSSELDEWLQTLPRTQLARIQHKAEQLFHALGPGETWLQQQLITPYGFLSRSGFVPHCQHWIINDQRQWNTKLSHAERLAYITSLPYTERQRLFSKINKEDPLLNVNEPRASLESILAYIESLTLEKYDIPRHATMSATYTKEDLAVFMKAWLERTSLNHIQSQSHDMLEWIKNEPWTHQLLMEKISKPDSLNDKASFFWAGTLNHIKGYCTAAETCAGPHGWKMKGLIARNREDYLVRNGKDSAYWIQSEPVSRIPDVEGMSRHILGYHAGSSELKDYRNILDINTGYANMYTEWTDFDTTSLSDCIRDLLEHAQLNSNAPSDVKMLPSEHHVLHWLWRIQKTLPVHERETFTQLAAIMDIQLVVENDSLDMEKSSVNSEHYLEHTLAFLNSYTRREQPSIDFLEIHP